VRRQCGPAMIKGNKREKENGVVGKEIKAIGTM